MSTILMACPSCEKTGRAPEEAVGFSVVCPACNRRYRVQPAGPDEPLATPPRRIFSRLTGVDFPEPSPPQAARIVRMRPIAVEPASTPISKSTPADRTPKVAPVNFEKPRVIPAAAPPKPSPVEAEDSDVYAGPYELDEPLALKPAPAAKGITAAPPAKPAPALKASPTPISVPPPRPTPPSSVRPEPQRAAPLPRPKTPPAPKRTDGPAWLTTSFLRKFVFGPVVLIALLFLIRSIYQSNQDPDEIEAQRNRDDPVVSTDRNSRDGVTTIRTIRKSGQVEFKEVTASGR